MKDLIYNQRDIPREELRYGFRSSAATGCGWVATYNALRLMGYRADKEELIRYYERQFPLVHGNTGTSVWGPKVCFEQWGFPVEFESRRDRFDEVAKRSDVCILFYHWRKKWRIGAHFVALQYQDGKFTGYNTFRNSKGPDPYGDSLEDFMKRKGFFGTALIGIRDKRKSAVE